MSEVQAMEDVGEIECGPSTKSVKWKIRDYFKLPREVDRYFYSPTFNFCDVVWHLSLCPNGESDEQSEGWISLYVVMKYPESSKHEMQLRLGIVKRDGSVVERRSAKHLFEEAKEGYVWTRYFKASELKRERDELVPVGVLTIFCSIAVNAPEGVEAAVQTERLEASSVLSRRDASPETIQEDLTETAAEKLNETDNAVIPAGTWQTRISQLYDTKENADVRFAVNGRIFEAHRLVLGMRSPEFSRILITANESVYTHIVDAESVTEAGFDILLRFLYTDSLGTTDKQSIIETYLCALVYRVADLQDKCKVEMEAWDITAEEIFSLLDLGLDVPTLKDKCMRLLRTEGRAALSHPAFLKISSKCLRCVLEGGVLENVPVCERIERIMEWCVHPHAEGADHADARNKLLNSRLLGRLEFENLKLEDLSFVVSSYQGLITPEELMCFLTYKHTKDSSVLPDWCLPESTAAS